MSKRLLLVEWDVADWKVLHPLMDEGEMPALNRLVEEGVSGELLSTQPILPAALCTSIITGKRAWQHRICHAGEVAPDGRRIEPVTAARLSSPTLWQMLAHAGKCSLVVGWPATHGDQTGHSVIVSDRYANPTASPGIKPWPPAAPGTYWPREIGSRLDARRVSPQEIGAEIISDYIPEWKTIDQKRDHRLGQLRLLLAADFSCQSAALELITREKWDFAAFRFPALAPISRLFMAHHLSESQAPAGEESAIYRNVVRAGYRLLDKLLNQLIAAAGANTTIIVVSGHGLRRPSIASQKVFSRDPDSHKSPYGIFVAKGPSFGRDALLHGASVLDVTPTILTWFGLPIGEDMEGRVLLESFTNLPTVTRSKSWDSFIKTPPQPADEDTQTQTDDQLIASWRRESDWNFVQSGLEASRYEKVLPVLNRLFRAFPERVDIAHALFQCQLAMKQFLGAAETLEVILELVPAGVPSLLPRAELALAQGNNALARQLAGEVYQSHPRNPMVMRKLGLLLLRLREWHSLEEVARQALSLDEHDPIAWLGLAAAQLRKHESKAALESANRAISLKYFLPEAHFILARALVAQGRWVEARDTMQTFLKLQPDNRVAAAYFKRIPKASLSTGADRS